jgi:hypothetical protein
MAQRPNPSNYNYYNYKELYLEYILCYHDLSKALDNTHDLNVIVIKKLNVLKSLLFKVHSFPNNDITIFEPPGFKDLSKKIYDNAYSIQNQYFN